jgi:hypothetical protein
VNSKRKSEEKSMKKVLFLLVASIILIYAGISPALAQDAKKKTEAPAAAEKAKSPSVKAETLSGTLVSADKKIAVVAAANGIPFNFTLTGGTRVKVGGNKAKLADLSGAAGKSVSVKFLAQKKAGNVAQSIEVQ